MTGRLSFVLWLMTSLARAQQETEGLCRVTSGAQVTVDTQRSHKGNWVTKVDLERGGGRGQMSAMRSEPWSVSVDSDTRTCEGAESRLHVTLTMTAPLPKLGAGYELFAGVGYYKFHTDVTTWADARQRCAQEGAHLAIINSEAEAEVLKKLFQKHPTIPGASDNSYAWVGVQRKNKDYFTIFGDTLQSTGFTRWHSGEPHKGESDDCILVTRPTGGLADVICAWRVAYFCESGL